MGWEHEGWAGKLGQLSREGLKVCGVGFNVFVGIKLDRYMCPSMIVPKNESKP